MMAALRIAALFAAYGTVAWGGDRAVDLLAQEVDARFGPELIERFAVEREATLVRAIEVEVPEVVVEVPDVVVEVRPSIVSRVQIRRSDECAYGAERELTIPVDAAGALSLDAGAGTLQVEGRAGLEEIVVVGTLCASHEEFLQEMDVLAERLGGGDVAVRTTYPRQRDRWDGPRTARIDLTVLVPRGLDVDVDDSSGDAEFSGTGDLRIDDSSGDLRIRAVEGQLRIDDSSGSVDVEDVTGDVTIADGSGGLDVRRVGGSLHLRDGSGGIDVASVEGDVVVETDGSGGIDVRGVGGDFVVERDGSGGIRHSDVDGRVEIPRKRKRR